MNHDSQEQKQTIKSRHHHSHHIHKKHHSKHNYKSNDISNNNFHFNKTIAISQTDKIDMTCPICYEEMKNPCKVNNCFHMFCFNCILTWCKQKLLCPLCKGSISVIYHYIVSDVNFQEYVIPIPQPELLTSQFNSNTQSYTPQNTNTYGQRNRYPQRTDNWIPSNSERDVYLMRKKIYTREIKRINNVVLPYDNRYSSLFIYNRIKPFINRELSIIFEDNDMIILTEFISRLLSNHSSIFYPPHRNNDNTDIDDLNQINIYNMWKKDRDYIYIKLYRLLQMNLDLFLKEVSFYLFSHLSMEYYDRLNAYKNASSTSIHQHRIISRYPRSTYKKQYSSSVRKRSVSRSTNKRNEFVSNPLYKKHKQHNTYKHLSSNEDYTHFLQNEIKSIDKRIVQLSNEYNRLNTL